MLRDRGFPPGSLDMLQLKNEICPLVRILLVMKDLTCKGNYQPGT